MRDKARTIMYWTTTACLTAMMFLTPRGAHSVAPQKVRRPGNAGGFYPADPKALAALIDDLLSRARPPAIDGPIYAVVAPHAGYQYSGPVAAYAYAALKGRKYSRVVVIAPSHYEAFSFASVYNGDAYETPLGTVPVDKDFARKLVETDPASKLSDRGHAPAPEGTEHAIEVQLPFLQQVLGRFTLVPIVMGDQSYESGRELGVALAKLIHGGDTLIVASSDLSHYHPYEDAVRIDHKTLDAFQVWDYFSMSRNFQTRVWEACGGAPIVAAMIASERMGADQADLLQYANSGDVTGNHSRVVGYSAVALTKTKNGPAHGQQFSLDAHDKAELLSVARASVEHAVREGKLYGPPATASKALDQERGAFVTIKKAGELRGCIGYTSPVKPLYLTVRDTATLAALRDPRFSPVTVDELGQLQYEVSVLSPLRRVMDPRQVRVGQDGLLIKNGEHEGLLLPQVPVEQKWDRLQFLEGTCGKAQMPPDCWKQDGTDIFSFTAVVFDEADHGAQSR